MDPEEQELLNDYRYRNYSSVIEKALRNFESSSEWADLISSLGKLNKKEDDTVVPEHSDDHCDPQVEDIWARSGCARLCCCLARAPSWDT
ncbi:Protein dopey-2 [Pteropus alecto]|uniref:Protein dopey-2 n=1 Tax=Pteropus alecto TaxID=9402 RepID=L5KDG5_PTEAL|nr:Protein dopey-2 [Pteropus alecto]